MLQIKAKTKNTFWLSVSYFFILPLLTITNLARKQHNVNTHTHVTTLPRYKHNKIFPYKIKKGKKKTRISFNSILFWGSQLFCSFERFPESAKAVASPRQSVEIYSSFSVVKVKFVVWPVEVFSEVFLAEAVTNWTHNLLLSSGRVLPFQQLREGARSNTSGELLVRENFSFRHALISIPVRGLLRKRYFWIFFLFLFFF